MNSHMIQSNAIESVLLDHAAMFAAVLHATMPIIDLPPGTRRSVILAEMLRAALFEDAEVRSPSWEAAEPGRAGMMPDALSEETAEIAGVILWRAEEHARPRDVIRNAIASLDPELFRNTITDAVVPPWIEAGREECKRRTGSVRRLADTAIRDMILCRTGFLAQGVNAVIDRHPWFPGYVGMPSRFDCRPRAVPGMDMLPCPVSDRTLAGLIRIALFDTEPVLNPIGQMYHDLEEPSPERPAPCGRERRRIERISQALFGGKDEAEPISIIRNIIIELDPDGDAGIFTEIPARGGCARPGGA